MLPYFIIFVSRISPILAWQWGFLIQCSVILIGSKMREIGDLILLDPHIENSINFLVGVQRWWLVLLEICRSLFEIRWLGIGRAKRQVVKLVRQYLSWSIENLFSTSSIKLSNFESALLEQRKEWVWLLGLHG